MSTDTIINPDFPISCDEAAADLLRMQRNPMPLRRPVLILAGWRAGAIAMQGLETLLKPACSAGDEDFLTITYPGAGSIQAACDRVRRAVADRGWTGRTLDVVAISMGGLVARCLAQPPDQFGDAPALPFARLFTLATPHRGARLAQYIRPDAAAADMRPGSPFMQRFAAFGLQPQTEFYPYALLRDWWVGARNTAPAGQFPIWADPTEPLPRLFAHFAINRDPRVLADIARRLRGEPPHARRATPPPRD